MVWWVLLVLLGFNVVCLLVDVKLLFDFEHPDDSKYYQGLVAKVVVIIGLQLMWLLITGLPTDVFSYMQDGGLDMEKYWQIIFLFMTLFIILPLPFAIFFYEADSDPRITSRNPWKRSACATFVVFAVCAALIGITYSFLNKSTLSHPAVECPATVSGLPSAGAAAGLRQQGFLAAVDGGNTSISTAAPDGSLSVMGDGSCVEKDAWTEVVKVNFFTYLMAISSFVGWFFFALYVGIGLVTLPLDLIVGFVDRPRPISQSEYSEAKKRLGEKATAMRQIAEDIKREDEQVGRLSGFKAYQKQRHLQSHLNKFKQSVHLLEAEYECLNVSLKQRGENPVVSYAKLVLGVVCVVLSMAWFLHIIFYMALSQALGFTITAFLNDLMEAIGKLGVYIVDLVILTVLAVYLLACVLKGSIKFGMRLYCCFGIHPLKLHETHLNTFLFNVAILLLTSSALVQFCTTAFEGYVKGTQIHRVFGQLIQNLKFYKLFYKYNVFVWVLVVWTLLNLLYFLIRPRDRVAVNLRKEWKRHANQPHLPPATDPSSVPPPSADSSTNIYGGGGGGVPTSSGIPVFGVPNANGPKGPVQGMPGPGGQRNSIFGRNWGS